MKPYDKTGDLAGQPKAAVPTESRAFWFACFLSASVSLW